MGSRFVYTDEMLSFLREEYPRLGMPALVGAFNERFGTSKSRDAIKSALSNNRIVSGRPVGTRKGQYQLFTQEQADFVAQAWRNHTAAEVARLVNAKFGLSIREGQIRTFVKNHDMKNGRDTRFKPGHVPANKGRKGYSPGGRSVETQFKRGHRPANTKDGFFHERICSKNGYILIKVPEINPYTGTFGWYRAKHRWIWEAEVGPIPDGHAVVFLDGDQTNCDIENLRCVPRGVLTRFNKMQMGELQGEERKAAWLTAEVIHFSHALEREKREESSP
ncbi:MAG: HNH endonuclease signature motif containing protein [Pseudomonadota bacterium]